MKSNILTPLGLVMLSFGALSGAWAADEHHQLATTAATAPAPDAALTAGEVRKIDAAQGKLTIRHEAIANLDMPPMTMVFRAASPELLNNLKPGDKIRFRAESKADVLVVTRIEPVQ